MCQIEHYLVPVDDEAVPNGSSREPLSILGLTLTASLEEDGKLSASAFSITTGVL